MERNQILFAVAQYLKEGGYDLAFLALQEDLKLDLGACLPEQGSSLLSMLDELTELRKNNNLRVDPEEIDCGEADESFAFKSIGTFHDIHGANVLSVKIVGDKLISTSADRTIARTSFSNFPFEPEVKEKETIHHADSPLISSSSNPAAPHIVALGGMDASLTLFDTSTNKELQKFKDHKKYVVRSCWTPDGKFLASSSYDHSLCIYKFDDEAGKYTLAKHLQFNGAVEGLAMSTDFDKYPILVAGVRDDNRLHVITFPSLEETLWNLNPLGDDHVSFNALDLSFSPNGKYVLISTDKGKLILYNVETKKQLRWFYGADNDAFSQPRHCWHPNGRYVYSTSQDNSILVWDVSSQKQVQVLKGHSATIRDLTYSPEHNILISGGFDKSIIFWG